MNLSAAFVDQLQADLGRDLSAFLPELILCGTIVLLLLSRLLASLSRIHACTVAMLAAGGALAVAVDQWGVATSNTAAFAGMLVADPFGLYVRVLLLAFLFLILLLTRLTGIPDRDDSADFATLVLGATLGMMVMASVNHLLMVFIAIEMASVPSYVLSGFLKGRRHGSEAALKYVVYGASASGVMLFGISLLAGRFGTGYLPDFARAYQTAMTAGGGPDAALLAGTLFVIVGLGYKLAAAPFHFWCPDVFEGAAAEVDAFLSVASKAAALALTARLLNAFAGPAGSQSASLFGGSIGVLVGVMAAATATFGNLAALGQSNLKRLLAYSTIAHAGYMLMALVPISVAGNRAVLFYLAAYLLTNLGAFASVAFIRNATGSEDLSNLGGLIHRSPWLVVPFAIFLLSLLGLPPLAGFAAKFQVFAALYDAGRHAGDLPNLQATYYGLLIVAAVNTVISAAYYLKVLRVMVLDAPPAVDTRLVRCCSASLAYVALLALAVVLAGVGWDFLSEISSVAARGMSGLGTPK